MNKYLMILLCSVATMLPRMVPLFVRGLDNMPRFLKKCMLLLPIASLGALIFPLALTDFGIQWYAGLGGIVAAFVSSYFKKPMIVSILFALAATTLLLLV